LAVGEYEFAYVYFERGGGSAGEFFYAPGKVEAFDPAAFVLVGDGSKGIGVTAEGITATAYKAVAGTTIDNLTDAIDLYDGIIDMPAGFPASETIPTADVHNSAGSGRFTDDHPVPGLSDPSTENWTDQGPYGWTRDSSKLPPNGQPEYNGWTFMKKDFWLAEQGDQSRSDFEKGTGVVALVDPDAFDDFVEIDVAGGDGARNADCAAAYPELPPEDCGHFNASMSTAPVYLNGVAANSATLTFDSSWWDETTQTAEGRVEYFDEDGDSMGVTELFRWDSLPSVDTFYEATGNCTTTDSCNETVEFPLNNPAGAASMVITFAMPSAQNDWWWAIDNVQVKGDVAGALFAGISDKTTWNFNTTSGGVLLPGDIDGDGTVAFPDFVILADNFNEQVDPGTNGDIDGSGTVDFADFVILADNFGKSSPAAASVAVAPAAADSVFAPDDDLDDDLGDLLGDPLEG
jgi:hypothetical protein